MSSRQAQFKFRIAFDSSPTDATALPLFGPLEGHPDLLITQVRPSCLLKLYRSLLSNVYFLSGTGCLQCRIHSSEYKVACLTGSNTSVIESTAKIVQYLQVVMYISIPTYWAFAPAKSPVHKIGLSLTMTQVWTVETGVVTPIEPRYPIRSSQSCGITI